MDVSLVLSLGEGLVVERVEQDAMTLTVFVASTALIARCPLCQEPADSLHSHYQRMVADLPCGGHQVRLLVQVPKFRCKTTACPHKVFAERLSPLIEPWARQTTRLIKALQANGLATCGEGGARLAEKLSLPTSPTALLRRIMALPAPPVETCAGYFPHPATKKQNSSRSLSHIIQPMRKVASTGPGAYTFGWCVSRRESPA